MAEFMKAPVFRETFMQMQPYSQVFVPMMSQLSQGASTSRRRIHVLFVLYVHIGLWGIIAAGIFTDPGLVNHLREKDIESGSEFWLDVLVRDLQLATFIGLKYMSHNLILCISGDLQDSAVYFCIARIDDSSSVLKFLVCEVPYSFDSTLLRRVYIVRFIFEINVNVVGFKHSYFNFGKRYQAETSTKWVIYVL